MFCIISHAPGAGASANQEVSAMTAADDRDPRQVVEHLMDGYLSTQLLHVAAQLNLADALAAGPRSSTELAAETGTHPPALHRVLRGLVVDGVLGEDEAGRFILTDAGRYLQSSRADSMHGAVIARGQMYYAAAGALLDTVRRGGAAFRHANGVDFFTALTAHPERVAAFQASMTVRSQQEAAALVETDAFDGADHIVDVGGGHGILLMTLLAAHPHRRGTLFDRPDVIAGARVVLAAPAAAAVAVRCAVVAGDFFGELPAGGDLYLLSRVIHDWDDDAAVRILKSCRKAMTDDGRLILAEAVLPRRARDLPAAIRMDLHMLTLVDGKERTEEEFEQLQQVTPTAGSTGISAIAARPR
jgi:SAM-dependent methyltransferase